MPLVHWFIFWFLSACFLAHGVWWVCEAWSSTSSKRFGKLPFVVTFRLAPDLVHFGGWRRFVTATRFDAWLVLPLRLAVVGFLFCLRWVQRPGICTRRFASWLSPVFKRLFPLRGYRASFGDDYRIRLCTRLLVSSNRCAHDVDSDGHLSAFVFRVVYSGWSSWSLVFVHQNRAWSCACWGNFSELLSVAWLGNVFVWLVIDLAKNFSQCAW